MNSLLLIAALVLVLGLTPWFALMGLVTAAAGLRRPARAPTSRSEPAAAATTRFLVVIPAHDEAEVIAVTVRSCRALAYDPNRFQVAVIADNCTDATASVAEAAGATVWVRRDPHRRSKGFALEDFFARVGSDPAWPRPDAFVLVDADTSVAADLLGVFDKCLTRGDDFIQGYYTVRNADASWRTRMMTYAFSLANGVWLAGLDRLGLSVGLKGNGMCFRASALERFPWRAAGLVEDMEFAWRLRLGGERVRFEPSARVFGEMVSRGGPGAASQRQRWERGRQQLRATFQREVWRTPRLRLSARLLYALDLRMPPLSRLLIGLSAAAGLGIAARATAGAASPSLVLLAGLWVIEGAVLLFYVGSPFLIMRLPARYAWSLAAVPYYVAWKVLLGLRRGPRSWVRTPRETAPR